MLKPSEINEKFEEGTVQPSQLYRLLIEERFITEENYPYAMKMKLEDNKTYNTFCPFHEQKNGDSYHMNKGNKSFCWSTATCPASKRPMGLLELTFVFVFNVDPASVFEYELTKEHYWPAVQFLVKHFGDELGITLNDVTSKGVKVERNISEEILRHAMEYYHFLATKTAYSKKLEGFLTEQRFFQYGTVPLSELIATYKLGITPRSATNDKLFQLLLKKKYTKEEILASKLCRLTPQGEIKDVFQDRAIVPYIHKGKTIGLYGRALNKNGDKSFRHYRLEGEVRIPNGLDGILEENEFFLVEGEFSKLAVASLGFKNVMEARGVNGFKVEHAEMIQRVRQNNPDKCKVAYMLFDPDDAGADSVKKIGHRLMNAGVEVKVIRLPVLYQEGEAIFVDPNDLLKIYQDKALSTFKDLKEEAVSLDAFLLIHELKKNAPKTLSEARMTMIRYVHYFDSIHPLERIFLLEEVLELMETSIDKNVLRGYLQEIWLKAEQKKPVEGFEKAISSKQAFVILTKSEELFNQASPSFDNVILVRDLEVFKTKSHTKNMFLDDTFSASEEKELSRKGITIQRGKLEFSTSDKTFSYERIES